ncbi:MAG TPA: FkbM family methyltransferase [Vicinamibacterales bacterium]|nr:FkbM family methyltransferase [Vicinamibacterales bacterium]
MSSLDEAFSHLYSTYFGERQHERDEIENLPNLLKGCELFIDVGASLGMYTYYANRALEGATIIAIEADPDRFEELRKNCLAWQGERSNRIVAVHAALGDSRQPVRFFKTGSQISGGFFPVGERSSTYTEVEVPQMLLDDFYEEGRPTLVKIDVEGGEYRVLQGAPKHLAGGHTRFLLETHWWGDRERGTTTVDVLRFMYRQGFAIKKTVRPHTSNYHLWPAKGARTLPGYLKVAPLLVAKAWYGRYVPRWIRNLREQALNRRRRRRHGRHA